MSYLDVWMTFADRPSAHSRWNGGFYARMFPEQIEALEQRYEGTLLTIATGTEGNVIWERDSSDYEDYLIERALAPGWGQL